VSEGGRPGRPGGALGWVDDATTVVRRAAPGPILVRAGVFVAGLLAELIAWPADVVLGRLVLVLLGIAVLPVFAPRSRLVTGVIFATVFGWLAATSAYGEPIGYWRPVALAALLYLLHTLTALAAVLPYDAVVSPGVLAGWLRRAGVVVLLTAAVAMLTLLIPQYVGGQRYLAASLVGLALMMLLAGYLAALVRRR
jgi:hypothetical protein